MHPRRTHLRVVAGAVALAAAVALLALPATATELQEVLKVRNTGNESSAKSQDTVDKLSDQTEDLARDYRQVLEEIDSLRVYNDQLQKLIDAQESDAASLDEQIERVALVGRGLTPLMLKMIDALEAFVSLDVPFLLDERGERVAQLRELMGRADVADSEKYRRILEAYQVENEYGRTIEAYRGEIELGGASRTVEFLRVGRVVLVYQTLDAEEIGVWDGEAGQWVALSGEYRLPIRQGLRIARKQAAPDLIRLPVRAAEAVR